MMNIFIRRYMCLDAETTKAFTSYKQTNVKNMNDIKRLYEILDNVVNKVSATCGPHVFFTINSLFMDLLNSFNWFLFHIELDTYNLLVVGQIMNFVLHPLIYCVSKTFLTDVRYSIIFSIWWNLLCKYLVSKIFILIINNCDCSSISKM